MVGERERERELLLLRGINFVKKFGGFSMAANYCVVFVMTS